VEEAGGHEPPPLVVERERGQPEDTLLEDRAAVAADVALGDLKQEDEDVRADQRLRDERVRARPGGGAGPPRRLLDADRLPLGRLLLARRWFTVGQRMPTAANTMQSGQIGRSQLEHLTAVSVPGCR
jgi:hypothetical protein